MVVSCVAVNDTTNYKSLDVFTNDFISMLSENNQSGSFDNMLKPLFSQNEESGLKFDEITNRLIVKSSEPIDYLDAVNYVSGYDDLHIIQYSSRNSFIKAREYYSKLSCVEYVEEDSYLTEAVVNNGSEVVFESVADYPTSVQSNIFGYSTAKTQSDGYSVDIAVIDSGVEINHEFLKGRVVDSGVDVINNSGTANDDRGHGTHVAGIIVSNTLDNVTVHAYKALNNKGSGTAAQVSLAIDAAIEDGVDIINLSLTMQGISETLHAAVKKAYDAGVCVIVAAGNAGVDIAQTEYSPGSFSECITVMSCNNSKRLLSTSNYGTPCDFAAPGENILSSYIGNAYKLNTGTSMATPFICAAASYLLSKNNTLTPEQIRSSLAQKTSWCFGSPSGKYVMPSTAVSLSGKTAQPIFELDSATFIGKISVSIAAQDDADIFYYLDGNSSLIKSYSEAIVISETTKITAFAITNGKNMSESVTAIYTKIDGNVSDFVVTNNTLVSYLGTQSFVTVPSVVNGEKIYRIGKLAFADNQTITNLQLESCLSEIDESAFIGCTRLQKVTAPGLETIKSSAFESCAQLVTFASKKLLNIGDNAFKNCISLTSFDFSNVKTIGNNSFENTPSLKVISCPVIERIGDFAFAYSGLIEMGITNAQSIGTYAFFGCESLSFVLLSNATILGEGAFKNCAALSTVSALALKEIPAYCFAECVGLSSFEFSSVETVCEYAFENCELIKNFNFPIVKTVKAYAFKNCGLTSLTSSKLTTVEEFAFDGCRGISSVSLSNAEKVNLGSFIGCSQIQIFQLSNATEIIFPENGMSQMYENLRRFDAPLINELPDYAFDGCKKLTEYLLTDLKSVGKYAFRNTGLSDISFSYLTSADVGAFSGMTSVTSIYLPKLQAITSDMFDGDYNVTSVKLDSVDAFPVELRFSQIFPKIKSFSANKIEEIPANIFSGCTSLNAISFENLYTIGEEAFKDCALNGGVVLYADSIGVDALDGNPITSINLPYIEYFECDFFGSSKNTIEELRLESLVEFGQIYLKDFTALEILEAESVKTIPADFCINLKNLKNVYAPVAESVGDNSFYGCSALEIINIDSAESIGNQAFSGCSSLTEFYADSVEIISNSVFSDCENLEIISLDSLTQISTTDNVSPFGGMKNLRQFYGGSLQSVPAHAFENCTSLSKVNFGSATNIGEYAFNNTSLNTYHFGKLKYLGNYAFRNTKIQEFTCETLRSMGCGTFMNCEILTGVSIPNISQIPDNAFRNCKMLTGVTSGSLTIIGKNAFDGCSQLSRIRRYGSSAKLKNVELGDYAFKNCSNFNVLNSIDPAKIGSYALQGTKFSANGYYELKNLREISSNAFDGITLSVLILENVEKIYDVPECSMVLVGTDVVDGNISPDTTATIYSPEGSVASQYCLEHGINYVEFNENSTIVENTPNLLRARGESFYFEAVGFNLEYAWYGFNEGFKEDAVLLDSDYSFTPFPIGFSQSFGEGDFEYFCCVATSTENGNVVEIVSNPIRNTFTYIKSINERTEIYYDEEGYILSDAKNTEELFNDLYIEDGTFVITPSMISNSNEFYGTGSFVDIYVDDELWYNYLLVLQGDVNGDGYVDVLDCSYTALVANGLVDIEDVDVYLAAGSYDGKYDVSIADYQAVVNKAMS